MRRHTSRTPSDTRERSPAEGERFLDRWSRRKRAAEEADARPAEQESETTTAEEEMELPSLDELGPDSDYSAFMREGVPPDVRNRALRALWRSDPARFAPDGLEEYGGDHTTSPVVGAAVKTVFQVARGAPPEAEPDQALATGSGDDGGDEEKTPGDAEV